MKDKFSTYSGGLNAPASEAEAVMPNDQTDLPWVTRALYVGTAGNVRATMLSGETVDFIQLQGGIMYPLRIRRVHAAGTDAADLVALR